LYFVFLVLPATYFVLRIIAKRIAKRSEETEYGAERIFRRFQAGMSFLVGFAIGSNDVTNSITPVLAIYFVMKNHGIPATFNQDSIPMWMLAIGGLEMSVGVLVLGHKVIATTTTIIVSSMLGIPVSSTHAATGAVIGVGLEHGIKGLNFVLLAKIFLTWIVTVPASAVLTVVIFGILNTFVSLVM
jgi:PiT family inorganic phosphate transporter